MLAMITVTHNSSRYLEKLVKSVEDSTVRPLIWVFVDSGSSDGTAQLLHEISANSPINMEIICLKRNVGHSRGVDMAVSRLRRKDLPEDLLLLICNADGYFGKGSLEGIISCYRSGIGMIQPLIRRVGGGIDSAGNLMSLSGVTCPSSSSEGFFYLSGACFLIPLKIYLDVGGMDRNIFMGADDLDLSWRVMLREFELKICPNSVFFHYGRSGEEISPRRMEWRVYSIIWTMAKCLPFHLVAATFTCAFIHLGASLILSIRKRTPIYVLSVVKAVLMVLKNAKILMRSRRRVREGVAVDDKHVLRKMAPTGLVLKIALRRYLASGD